MNESAIPRATGTNLSPDGTVLVSLACCAVLVTSWLLPSGGIPGIDLCAFHAWTGLPCPGCGLTRAFCALSHGRFQDAWNLHPFSYPIYGLVLSGVAAPLLARRFPALAEAGSAKRFKLAILVWVAGLMVFGGWRAYSAARHRPAPHATNAGALP